MPDMKISFIVKHDYDRVIPRNSLRRRACPRRAAPAQDGPLSARPRGVAPAQEWLGCASAVRLFAVLHRLLYLLVLEDQLVEAYPHLASLVPAHLFLVLAPDELPRAVPEGREGACDRRRPRAEHFAHDLLDGIPHRQARSPTTSTVVARTVTAGTRTRRLRRSLPRDAVKRRIVRALAHESAGHKPAHAAAPCGHLLRSVVAVFADRVAHVFADTGGEGGFV
mmetsp:Transcript_42986/g.84069  ORF Transcript_42986/g.84069 Transcript_42986/m.84069 type:complete len:223 (-) Transcript_42986:133-801(-)